MGKLFCAVIGKVNRLSYCFCAYLSECNQFRCFRHRKRRYQNGSTEKSKLWKYLLHLFVTLMFIIFIPTYFFVSVLGEDVVDLFLIEPSEWI